MGSGLVKIVDPVGAIFCGYIRDGTKPGIEGYVEIDLIVA